MPVVKIKNHKGDRVSVEVGYHNLLFKNDLVDIDNVNGIEEVKTARYSEGSGRVEIEVFCPKGQSGSRYGNIFHLRKRPFKNWIKYILVILTKKYHKQA